MTGYKGETIEIKISNKCCTISLVQDWQGYKIQKNWSVFERLPDKPINENISKQIVVQSVRVYLKAATQGETIQEISLLQDWQALGYKSFTNS